MNDLSSTPAPPQRYYGYVMVGVAVATMICTLPGQTILVSQFNEPIRAALDLSLREISLAYLIGTSLAALPLTLVGKAADRFGLRVVVGVVALSFTLALCLLGQARGFLSLTAGFALVRFLGQGSLGMLSSHILAMWFERRLGVMESIKHVGFSLATLVLPALTVALIDALGWRRALVALGLGVAAVVLPLVATVFRNRPEDLGQRLDGDHPPPEGEDEAPTTPDPAFTLGEAVRTRALWTLLAAGPYLGLVGTAMLFHTQPILASLGVADPKASAPYVQAPWPIALTLTPLFSGWLADNVEARWLVPAGLLLAALSCACLGAAGQGGLAPTTWFALAMAVFGVAMGVMVSAVGPTIARYFGRAHHGAIRGLSLSIGVGATATGPFLLSEGAHLAGGRFDLVFVAFACAALPLALAGLTLRRPAKPETRGSQGG